jgi:RNase P/RNase MRP subunit p29
MALVSTTLTSAVTVTDTSIAVTSATSVAAGRFLRIDGETMLVTKAYVVASLTVPVLRGVDGTVVAAHPNTAVVVHGDATDWPVPKAGVGGSLAYPAQPTRTIYSYTAAGAITLTAGDSVHVLNGSSALAMTLAQPTAEMDGSIMYVLANGKYAHTVTVAGVGYNAAAGGYTVITGTTNTRFALALIANNKVWCMFTAFIPSGTITAAEAALS